MTKKDAAMKNGAVGRAFRRAGVVLGVVVITGVIGVPRVTLGAETGARGKRVGYVTFGLQFEYQVAMVDGIKKRADAAGLNLNIVDGKGDPNLQVTQVLDAVSKVPNALLINPVDGKLVVAGVKRANQANI